MSIHKAIQCAGLVVLLWLPLTEAQYSRKLDKPMILCQVEQGYWLDGWMVALTTAQSYIYLFGRFTFEDASGELPHCPVNIRIPPRERDCRNLKFGSTPDKRD
ncbi:hypothetical protein EGR_06153 [Echinococcus granulosus]|uniref:Uncharacterized protein n=1 Tax=Echinococcus granulosus TaxID=6210 RepID=W6ULM5_ECHGR|nr:hypothetical protein EGR_06153 [Echinococcus granulosus]EUB59037.1 hypothetical protein EGR_06153 [Echinococcus granulosus]